MNPTQTGKRIIAVLLCLCMLVAAAPVAFAFPTFSLNIRAASPGKSVYIDWKRVDGFGHYEYSVRDKTTNKLIYNHEYASYEYFYLEGDYVIGGHSYHVWVGAYDRDGTHIANGDGDFSVPECSHRWSDGYCTKCDAECPHDGYTYDSEESMTYKSVSSKQHDVTTKYHEVCDICRTSISRTKTRTTRENHNFDRNGDCTLCDYRAACTHKNTDYVLQAGGESYIKYDDEEHKHQYIYNEVCQNAACGKIVKSNIIEYDYEPHRMVNNECRDCGYRKTYPAMSVSVSRDSSTAYVGDAIGATCSVTGGSGSFNVGWTVLCNGSVVKQTDMNYNTDYQYAANCVGTWTFKATVRDKITGEQKSATSSSITVSERVCEHANLENVARANPEYKKISDIRHEVKITYDRVCKDCGDIRNSFTSTEGEDHIFSGNNCIRCGAAAPVACEHKNTKSEKQNTSLIENGSTQHHIVEILWLDSCNDCGIVLNSSRTTRQTENHSYNDFGVCLCGYAKPAPVCYHDNKSRQQNGAPTYSITDMTNHAVTYTYIVTCADCGILINSSEVVTKSEAHSFINDVCACGYAKPAPACGHTNTDRQEIGAPVYSVTDESNHTVTRTYTITCADCGALIKNNDTVTRSEAHSYTDNRCVCGYSKPVAVCKHPDKNRKENGSPVYSKVDEAVHTVTRTYTVTCADCGIVINNSETVIKSESHSFTNSVCVCGYVKPAPACDHADKKRRESGTPVYSIVDENYHTVTRTYTITCADCGRLIKNNDTVIKTESHSYTNNVCDCGAELKTAPEIVHVHAFTYRSPKGEAAHPHKMFVRCDCGFAEYLEGEYYTANGAVQSEDDCCVCHGHRWSADEPVSVQEEWRVYCDKCNAYKTVEEPKHEHVFAHGIKASETHPHQLYGTCRCGMRGVVEGELYNYPGCCLCTGHDWSIGYYGSYLISVCNVCKTQKREQTKDSIAFDEYINLINVTEDFADYHCERYDVENSGSALWRVIASQAMDKLSDGGFVFGTQYMNLLAEPGEALTVLNDKVIKKDGFEIQQTAIWKELIVDMLRTDTAATDSGLQETAKTVLEVDELLFDSADLFGKFSENVAKSQETVNKLTDELRELRAQEALRIENLGVSSDIMYNDNLSNAVSAKLEADAKLADLNQAKEGLSKNQSLESAMNSIEWILAGFSATMEGIDGANEVKDLQNAYKSMCNDFAKNASALRSIIKDAQAVNNKELEAAAQEIYAELYNDYVNRMEACTNAVKAITNVLSDLGEQNAAFAKAGAKDLIKSAVDIGISKVGGKAMGGVSLAASLTKMVINHDEVMESAEELMALAVMSSNYSAIDIITKYGSDGYSCKLWADLQIRGCEKAHDFLEKHADSGIGKVKISELGIPAEDRKSVYTLLNRDIQRYETFGENRLEG